MYFISHLILTKDFICFGVLNWLKSKVAEHNRQYEYFWKVLHAKLSWRGKNWNHKGQALSHFLCRPITMFRSHMWNIHVSKNNSAVSGSFSRQLFIEKKAKLQNAMQGSSWKSDFSETINWNCFVFSLDASVGWCKVQQLDIKICTLWHTNKCYTRFFYKNNFIRTTRPKFAQNSRIITCSISLEVFLQFFLIETLSEQRRKSKLHRTFLKRNFDFIFSLSVSNCKKTCSETPQIMTWCNVFFNTVHLHLKLSLNCA